MRRLIALALPVTLLLCLLPLAGVTAAGDAAVTGTISSKDKLALSPSAVAVVFLVDQQAGATGGTVIGTQRIDGAQWPVAFSVPYATSAIDPTHSYAVYATVVDATRTLQTIEPTPVITGGPATGVALTVYAASSAQTSTLPGTIVRGDKSALTAAAFAIAALVRQDTGTVEAYQIVTTIASEPIAFAIQYDPGIIDPSAAYVVRGGIVDETRSWTLPAPVPGITAGQPAASITLNVSLAGPTPSATPAPTAQPTPAPTAPPKPTPAPTAPPTATPAPTPGPTVTPEPSASPTAEASPTAAPTESPTESPSATPTPAPTPEPSAGTVAGTVTWGEDHVPTKDARLVVALVDVSAGDKLGTALASVVVPAPGPKPVPFQLTYQRADAVAGAKYSVVAALVDGDLAWVSETGVAVPVPEPVISGVAVPLTYRPDLLKAQVTGSLTASGLDGSGSSTSYASVLIVNKATGEIIGFNVASPIGAAPVPFEVPYSLTGIDRTADYALTAYAWDGKVLWSAPALTPVITKGSPTTDVTVALAAAPTPTPAPTYAPIVSQAPVPPPPDYAERGLGVGAFLLLLIGATVAAFLIAWAWRQIRDRRRR